MRPCDSESEWAPARFRAVEGDKTETSGARVRSGLRHFAFQPPELISTKLDRAFDFVTREAVWGCDARLDGAARPPRRELTRQLASGWITCKRAKLVGFRLEHIYLHDISFRSGPMRP